MDWLKSVAGILLVFGMWLSSSYLAQTFPTLRGKRITLLIAHPDDEAMFFAPTVLGLARPELENHINIFCLSSGNAEGLGSIRKQELQQSALLLGLKSTSDVIVIEDSKFPDSMTKDWPSDYIVSLLTKHIAATRTDTIITFDSRGISSHPNHRSLYKGAVDLLNISPSPPLLYTLTTTNTLRKYLSLFDVPITVFRVLAARIGVNKKTDNLLFVSDTKGYAQARRTMTEAHVSQMVWFRWGWIGLSRYMVVNDLKRVDGEKNL